MNKNRYGLADAVQNYWSAKTPREEQAAYNEIKLFGGRDGYPDAPPWRCAIARWLRLLALWVEND